MICGSEIELFSVVAWLDPSPRRFALRMSLPVAHLNALLNAAASAPKVWGELHRMWRAVELC